MYKAFKSIYPSEFASYAASFIAWTEEEEKTVRDRYKYMTQDFDVYSDDLTDKRGNFIEWMRETRIRNFVKAAYYQEEMMWLVAFYFKCELYSISRRKHNVWTTFNDRVGQLEMKLYNVGVSIGTFNKYLKYRIDVELVRVQEQIVASQQHQAFLQQQIAAAVAEQ